MDKFNLTFDGKIVDGFDLAEVKKRFAEVLLINDPERVEQFFCGKTVTIRRNLDKDTATVFYTKMYRVGVVLKLEPAHSKPLDKTSEFGIQHGFREERQGRIDQSWPIPSSKPRKKKPPLISKPGNAVKNAEERELKQAAEERKRLRDEESARIEADKVRKETKKAAEKAAAVRAEEKRKRTEEAARVKAEQKRIKAEETAKRKADALKAKKKASEEAAKVRAEEKRKRDEEAARVKTEQKRIKAEETAKRKADALKAKRKAAEEAAKIRAKEKHKRDEEAARVKAEQKRLKSEEAARVLIEKEARLAAEQERMLAQEIAKKDAEKAVLREQAAALTAQKKADEEIAIQTALDEIARKRAEEESAAQHALDLAAREQAQNEETRLRAELTAQKRKNAQEAARAKADEERIEDALRTLAVKRKNEENNRNLALKEDRRRQLELEESHKAEQRLAQEKTAERRAHKQQMEQAALQRAAIGTARLEELQRAAEAPPEPATKTHREPSLAKQAKIRKTTAIPAALAGAKRQPGSPNLFNLKPFRNTAEIRERGVSSLQLMKVMYIASVVALLTLLILGGRYALIPTPDAGITHADKIITNQHSSLFIAAGNEIFVLDRSGTDSKRYRFTDLGVGAGATLLNFDHSGSLLIQDQPAVNTGETSSAQRLLRCDLELSTCEPFTADIPNGKISDWITDIRTEDSFVAIAEEKSLSRLARDGSLISQQTMPLSSAVKLIFHEGLLYINSSTDPAIGVFRPDAKGFGEQLNDILLLLPQAQEQAHTRVNDFLWLANSWWVIMSNPDTHSSALYRFDNNWKYLSTIAMAPQSRPLQLLAWSNKVLVVDGTRLGIARFSVDAQAELPLTPKALASDIASRQASLIQSRRLWYACLGFLALLGVVAYVLGRLHQLRALVYKQDNVRGAEPIDDKAKAIRWIELDRIKIPALKRFVSMLATITLLVIGTLVYQLAPINIVIAAIVFFSGPAIALTLIAMSRPGHVGVLGDKLILVDHNNNYHIGGGARIHYRDNFLLLDDIAVYVGSRLMPVFSSEQLTQSIAPLARAGVKVDRKTVLVKLGQNAHPLTRGLIACAACLGGALYCLLLY